MTNPFVQYLTRFYTGGSAHEGVFDEYNLKEQTFGNSLDVITSVQEQVINHFRKPVPASLILTGNAGDGKTRICRLVVEQITGAPLQEWPSDATPLVLDCGKYRLKVIKDLSDFDETAAKALFAEMNRAISLKGDEEIPTVFLVAANEGKLRHTAGSFSFLWAKVNKQLSEGSDPDTAGIVVYNLNLERTSKYVPDVLAKMTHPTLWVGCTGCSAFEHCPIRNNRDRLADELVQERMRTLYEIVEQAGHHVTLRDMLIHLTHSLVGTTTCSSVQNTYQSIGNQLWRNAYYQNCWAVNDPSEYRRVIAVVNHLEKFMLGEVSDYQIDSFILNGGDSDEETRVHASIFSNSVDLGGGLFARLRTQYRNGQGQGYGEAPEVLAWLPHCRRKLYFEWRDARAERLIPFETVLEFRKLIRDTEGLATEAATHRLIIGLNRAFTGLYLSEEDELFITSHYTGSREQPVPVIKASVPYHLIDLSPFPDHHPDRLVFAFRYVGAHAPRLEINQLLYEYLIRLAEGGTRNVLAQECELRVRQFKEELLAKVGLFSMTKGKKPEPLRFFNQTETGFVQHRVVIQADGKVKVTV